MESHAQDTNYAPENQQIPPPSCLTAQANWQELHRGQEPACDEPALRNWLADVRHWRDERRIRTGYDGSRYALLKLQWAQSAFMQLT